MQIPHDKFCILPWISLEASPIGTVRPCCLALEEIFDDNGDKFHLATASFDRIQNSSQMQKLRNEFLAGKLPSTCKRCWKVEDSGGRSKRQHTIERLKHVVSDTEWTTDAKPLVFLDLKLGNICNLKCRICGSWSSSNFAAEEVKFTRREEVKNSYAYEMLQAGAWPRENPVFWSQIEKHLDQLRYIEFTGGEPFLIDEHFDMLQSIVDRGLAGNIEIHYNTNGTTYPERGEAIWKHYKTVEIAFSIDDVAERFEYQRSNAVWQEVCENLDRFRDLKEIHSNIVLQVCTTVNVFNVYYLEHVAKWIEHNRNSFNYVYWNLMHDAWYFSIAALPEQAKLDISQHLESVEFPIEFQDEIKRIIQFMHQGASTDGTVLRMKIRDLDFKRKQNLAEVEPELAKIIGYEYT